MQRKGCFANIKQHFVKSNGNWSHSEPQFGMQIDGGFDHKDPIQLSACRCLIHLPLDKMAVISQTICSDAFLWMKGFIFWLKFYWGLFLGVKSTITQHGSGNVLAPNRWQAIIRSNADLIHWGINVARGGEELIYLGFKIVNYVKSKTFSCIWALA